MHFLSQRHYSSAEQQILPTPLPSAVGQLTDDACSPSFVPILSRRVDKVAVAVAISFNAVNQVCAQPSNSHSASLPTQSRLSCSSTPPYRPEIAPMDVPLGPREGTDPEKRITIDEQKRMAAMMTPESVWRHVPSLLETPRPAGNAKTSGLRRRALEIYEKHHEASVYESRRILGLADALWDSGRFIEAEELDRLTIELSEQMFGLEHIYTVQLKGNLASALWGQGRLSEAEQLELSVIETMKHILGEYDEYTLTYMRNLSCTYRKQGRWKEAIKLSEEKAQKARISLGEEHTDMLTYKFNLAWAYWLQHRWSEARKLLEHVSESRSKLFGFEDKLTLRAYASLAYTLHRGGWRLKLIMSATFLSIPYKSVNCLFLPFFRI